jgi:putative NADH-flavin reductase
MRIALFGGTGRVGARVLEYALDGAHTLRALVRDPSKLVPRAGLEVVTGDVLDPTAVARTIAGADAVLSTLGGAGLADPGEAQSQGMRNILTAMKAAGIRRIIAVANRGVMDSSNGGLVVEQPDFPEMFRPVTLRHAEAWRAMQSSGLDGTMLVFSDIVAGTRTSTYRTREDKMPAKAERISVEDAADLMLRVLADGSHVGKRLGAAY